MSVSDPPVVPNGSAKPPSLATLRELARVLYVGIAEFRASTDVKEAEVEPLELAMKDAAQILEQLDEQLAVRKAEAERGS